MEAEKQLKKLEGILELLETDRASTDEVASAFEVVLDMIAQMKTDLEQEMANNKGEMTDKHRDMYSEMEAMEKRMSDMHAKMSDKMGVDKKEMMQHCEEEVKKCMDMMPVMPDLTPLDKKIMDVEAKIPKIPDEITANQMANKLNTLEEEIDIEVIKGLKKKLEDLEKKWSSRPMFGGGGLSRHTADSLYATIGSTGGLSILTATGDINGVNTDFTFASKPNAVIVNGATYRENKGWAWTAGTLTATLDFAPQEGSDVYGI
jgi:hypothetical protein